MVSDNIEIVAKELVAKRRLSPGRIDKYLCSRLQEYSRTFIQKLIKQGDVLVNDIRVKPSHEISLGDRIKVMLPRKEEVELQPQDIPLDIIYEDKDILVLNKPADMVVHPARGHKDTTLVNGILYYCGKDLSDLSGFEKPGIIHRLDRDTTGILLVAKNNKAHSFISRQFERRTLHKSYLCVVEGELKFESDCIDKAIGRHPKIREKMAVRRKGEGRESSTIYHVLEMFSGYALLDVQPKTGRTHQIRVHMSSIGHPIVGDYLYGAKDEPTLNQISRGMDPDTAPLIERQALHARSIEFLHPSRRERVKFEAPVPDDMKRLISALEKWRLGKGITF